MTRQHSRLHKEPDLGDSKRASQQFAAERTPIQHPITPLHPISSLGHWPCVLGRTKEKQKRAGCRRTAEGSAVAAHFAVAALPAELMHSERSSRLSKSVVGSALLTHSLGCSPYVRVHVWVVGIPIRSFRRWRGWRIKTKIILVLLLYKLAQHSHSSQTVCIIKMRSWHRGVVLLPLPLAMPLHSFIAPCFLSPCSMLNMQGNVISTYIYVYTYNMYVCVGS